MPMPLTPQRTIDYGDPPPNLSPSDIIPPIKAPKRKPSARAAFRLEEIPVVADAMNGTYALRDRLLFRCNTVWGLRAHEQLGMTVGDICYPNGSLKDSFVIESHRLKGGKPKPAEPPKRPDHYSKRCHCPKCTLYDGRRQPKAKQPPAARHLLILPEMKPLLAEWIGQIHARLGKAFSMDTPLWLSRKMRARKSEAPKPRPISRQMYWHIIVSACKRVSLPDFDWHDFGDTQRQKNDCDTACGGYRRYHRRAALHRPY